MSVRTTMVLGVGDSVLFKRFDTDAEIMRHETAIANGEFLFFEHGYDQCLIQPRFDK